MFLQCTVTGDGSMCIRTFCAGAKAKLIHEGNPFVSGTQDTDSAQVTFWGWVMEKEHEYFLDFSIFESKYST